MPKLLITKSIDVNVPAEKAFSVLNDFNHWKAWSPWLIMEPETKVEVAPDAKFYEWKGSRVGEGNMLITGEEENKSVDYDLNFLKPWKSKAKVRFELSSKGATTQISWHMDSSLPFFMFWMKKMMTAYVGMDYERGLALLKDYLEDGTVHSQLNFKGIDQNDSYDYVGVTTSCSLAEVGDKMKEDFSKLNAFIQNHEGVAAGVPFSIYHKWDPVKNEVKYTSGFPVTAIPKDLGGEMVTGNIPQHKVYAIEHKGPYDHLGNAWSSLYSMERNKEIKCHKQIHPYEVYLNNPHEVEPNELITEVRFPLA